VDRRRLLIAVTVGVVTLLVLLGVGRFTSPPATDRSDPAPPPPPERATSMLELPQTGEAPTEPGGYPRTAEGAVAAATAYGLALDGPALFDPAHRDPVLDAVAAEDAREDLAAAFYEGAELITSQLGLDRDWVHDPGFVWRVIPGGWQLRDYDRSSATIAIWAAVVVMLDDRLLVEPGWQTSEVELVWERGAWRLVGFRTEPGPNPTFAGGPSIDPVGQRINEFAPFRYWPDEPHGEDGP
jgi:hypothetical protein